MSLQTNKAVIVRVFFLSFLVRSWNSTHKTVFTEWQLEVLSVNKPLILLRVVFEQLV